MDNMSVAVLDPPEAPPEGALDLALDAVHLVGRNSLLPLKLRVPKAPGLRAEPWHALPILQLHVLAAPRIIIRVSRLGLGVGGTVVPELVWRPVWASSSAAAAAIVGLQLHVVAAAAAAVAVAAMGLGVWVGVRVGIGPVVSRLHFLFAEDEEGVLWCLLRAVSCRALILRHSFRAADLDRRWRSQRRT